MRSKGLLASVGVATATVTTFAGFAPAVVSTAGAADGTDDVNSTAADATADGTYESCSAYFGYGKVGEVGALDLTTFPVTVEGGTPAGEVPTVENGGIDVVLVITDVDGAELRCVPEEVTEAEWDATWSDEAPDEFNIPAWPGPGHYVYPTIPPSSLGPIENERLRSLAAAPAAIGDLGELASVGFEVTGVPEGYTLVDPTATETLPQVFFGTIQEFILAFGGPTPTVPPAVNDVIEAGAGPAAVAAFGVAFDFCVANSEVEPEPPLPNGSDPDLVAAVQALADFLLKPGIFTVEPPISCSTVGSLLGGGLVLFAIDATIDNESPITVSLPVEPTTTAPPAAAPAQVTPAFTG
jgi:hypothetical protein